MTNSFLRIAIVQDRCIHQAGRNGFNTIDGWISVCLKIMGGEKYLEHKGIEVVVLDNEECKKMMREYTKKNPEVWYSLTVISIQVRGSPSDRRILACSHLPRHPNHGLTDGGQRVPGSVYRTRTYFIWLGGEFPQSRISASLV